MYQSFLPCREQRKTNRIITSTKNYFNTPKAFKELLKLQREANVEVLIWEQQSTEGVSANQPFHPKGYLSHDVWRRVIAATTTCMLVVRISRHSLCRINVNGIFVSRRRAKRNSLNRSGGVGRPGQSVRAVDRCMVGAIRGGIQELHASTHADSTTNAHGKDRTECDAA